jgi:hypothetical protein
MIAKVSDGDPAVIITTPYVNAGVNEKGKGLVSSRGYGGYSKKTSEGWEVAELYALRDHRPVRRAAT